MFLCQNNNISNNFACLSELSHGSLVQYSACNKSIGVDGRDEIPILDRLLGLVHAYFKVH